MEIAYLSEEEVLELHAAAVALHGGKLGVMNQAALESCLAQPRTHVFGQEPFQSISDKAAAYCYFINRLHPFYDGNKRTGFLAALHFLLQNKVKPAFDEDVAFEVITGVAEGTVSLQELREYFRSTTSR